MTADITDNFELKFSKLSNSLSDTKEIGKTIAGQLSPGQIVGFSGELGAGKTELIRAICEAFGDNSSVSSPTYTLENQYLLPNGINISHWDLYRLKSTGDIYSELVEQKSSQKSIILIEWPDLVTDLLDLMVLISSAREISLFARKS